MKMHIAYTGFTHPDWTTDDIFRDDPTIIPRVGDMVSLQQWKKVGADRIHLVMFQVKSVHFDYFEETIEIGVDYVQGYAVARPQTPGRILAASSAASFIQDAGLKAYIHALSAEILAGDEK